jgi:uncharacterized membrane protein YhaH (DUF805 family)
VAPSPALDGAEPLEVVMSNVPPPPTPPVPPPPPGPGAGSGGYGYGAYGAGPSATPGEPPLDQPYYEAPLPAAARRFFAKYATFSGRASRSEFWWWALISWLINFVLGLFENHRGADGSLTGVSVFFSVVAAVWGLAILVPWLALWWRRLHDADHSGWHIFWAFLPFVGWIILLVFAVQGPRPEGARFDR